MRFVAAGILSVLLTGCTHVVQHPDGSVEVRTFGASTVTIASDDSIKTESPGISEGLTSVLLEIPEAALRVLGGMAGGLASTPRK